MIEIAVFGLELFAAVAVAVGVVDRETLLECRLLGVVDVAGVADVAPYGQIVPTLE